jgi:hypothetical protein
MLAAGHAAAISLLRDLLAAGVAVDATDAAGGTALMAATSADNVPALYALLQAGADPTRTDRQGETALAKAQQAGRTWIVRNLRRGHVVAGGDIGPTPLAVMLKGVTPAKQPSRLVFETEPAVPRPQPKPPVQMGLLGRHLMSKVPAKPAPEPAIPDPNRSRRATRPLWPTATLPMR